MASTRRRRGNANSGAGSGAPSAVAEPRNAAPLPGPLGGLISPALFAATIFGSAFLLFQVQPITGKMVLPWFGGGSTVWITTLMFFQCALLAGYGYSHFLALRLTPKTQGFLHIALLVLALVTLPIIPGESWKPDGEQDPVWRLLLLLTVSVGPPYLLLSTTGPLLQHWFATRYPGRSPYPLYALSNVGSLLALLSYPIVIERFIGLNNQSWMFSGGFALFAGACALLAWDNTRRGASSQVAAASAAADGDESISIVRVLFWVALPAVATALLLAVTHQLTQDVAGIPLLWVLPLAVYLLTFILTFSSEKMYEPNLYTLLLIPVMVGGWYVLKPFAITVQIALYLLVLFMSCMSLHGETTKWRPGPKHLTAFYFMVSLGGALGGLFVGLAAPVLFNGYWEYHVALFATPLLVFASRLYAERERSFMVLGVGAACAAAFLGVFGSFLQRNVRESYVNTVVADRNFFGTIRVYDTKDPQAPRLDMQSGRILHGFQYQNEPMRSSPTGYYGPQTGVGLALSQHPARGQRPLTVGIVGLGAGMVSVYAKPGDDWTFYEISPLVKRMAEQRFSYVQDAQARGAKMQVLLGDARTVLEQQLERDGSKQFDVLVLDAFTSDAIPVHLLTREAVELYWKQLKDDGVLVVHISNAYIDLSPVVRGFAEYTGREARWTTGSGASVGGLQAFWVVVTKNKAFWDNPNVAGAIAPWPTDAREPVLWTDDYSNLYSLLTFD